MSEIYNNTGVMPRTMTNNSDNRH